MKYLCHFFPFTIQTSDSLCKQAGSGTPALLSCGLWTQVLREGASAHLQRAAETREEGDHTERGAREGREERSSRPPLVCEAPSLQLASPPNLEARG